MTDWLEDILSGKRKPDVTVTEHDALVEGIYIPVRDDLVVSDGVAELFPDPDERRRFAFRIADLYHSGVYADPPDVDPDPNGEHGLPLGAWLAAYRVDGREYWVQRSETYLVIFLPEEY